MKNTPVHVVVAGDEPVCSLEAGLAPYRAAWGPFERRATRRAVWRASPKLAAINGAPARAAVPVGQLARHELGQPEHVARIGVRTSPAATPSKVGYVGGYLVEDIQNHGNDLNLAHTFLTAGRVQLTESLRVFTQSDRVPLRRALRSGSVDDRADHRCRARCATTTRGAFSPDADDRADGTSCRRQLSFPRTDGVNYKDISPRVGAAWDVFGNGKTGRQGEPRKLTKTRRAT